jgi:hypothetical protein
MLLLFPDLFDMTIPYVSTADTQKVCSSHHPPEATDFDSLIPYPIELKQIDHCLKFSNQTETEPSSEF